MSEHPPAAPAERPVVSRGNAVPYGDIMGKHHKLDKHGTGSRRRTGVTLLADMVFFILVFLGAAMWMLSQWISQRFGVITIDQAMINLRGAGGEGAGGSDLIISAIVCGLILPLICAGLAITVIRSLRSLRTFHSPRLLAAPLGTVVAALLLVLAVPAAGATSLAHQVSLGAYIRSMKSGFNLSDFYVAPTVADTPDGDMPNLVVIYMESVEEKLSDDSIFEEDMLAPLEQATLGWDSFQLSQPANGGWTLGGIVDTQCGIPLRMADANITGDGLNATGETVDQYLPGATCLGDVLKGEGYTNLFLGGASSGFSGKGTFLRDHGFDDVYGYSEWLAAGETEFRDWGLSDRRVFANAKDQVVALHESSQPFNLTVLTLDTHPGDYVQPYCSPDTDIALASIYRCSMEQVADFVGFLEAQGYLEDTVVVVMGDHLRMAGEGDTYREPLINLSGRTIFNRIWSPDGIEIVDREIDQFDMYPTILEALGFTLVDGRAGIGVSALSEDPDVLTTRSLSQQEKDDLVQSRSQDFYDAMWGVTSTSSE